MAKRPAPLPTPAAPDPFLDSWKPFLWLGAIVLAIYAQTLGFGLTLLDDNLFVNEWLPLLSHWANIPALFVKGAFLGAGGVEVFYRPVLMLSFMIDAHLAGAAIAPWHLLNIVFHAASAMLVFSLFKKIGRKDAAFLLAAVFAGHPALAQAVAWVPGRTDSLSAVFLLASFNFFLDDLKEPRLSSRLWHLFFFALALLTKELAVVLPAVCLLYAALRLDQPRKKSLARLAAGWLCLLTGWHLARKAFAVGAGGYTAGSALASVFRNLPAALLYLGKAVIPAGLSTYPILADSTLAYGVAAAAVLGLALAFSRAKNPRVLLLGAGWFFAFLLPSFVYPKVSILPVFFEYRLYLPIIGLLMIVAETDWVKGFELARHRAALTAVVLLLGALAAADARNYRDSEPFWRDAVAHSPHSAFARRQLGIVYYFQRRFAEAETEDKQSIALNPVEPMVHNNLGVIYMNTGRLAEAQEEFLKELSIDPEYVNALLNLAAIDYQRGRRDEAAALWRRAARAAPDNIAAYANLAVYHLSRGEYDQAREQCDQIRRRGGAVPQAVLDALARHIVTSGK